MKLLNQFITVAAILVIFYAFYKAYTLQKKIPGGTFKDAWKFFYYIIGLLGVAYLSMPLLSNLPDASRELITGIIALAGAIFIVKIMNLLYKIIKEIGL